jgi:hypothetical protein
VLLLANLLLLLEHYQLWYSKLFPASNMYLHLWISTMPYIHLHITQCLVCWIRTFCGQIRQDKFGEGWGLEREGITYSQQTTPAKAPHLSGVIHVPPCTADLPLQTRL